MFDRRYVTLPGEEIFLDNVGLYDISNIIKIYQLDSEIDTDDEYLNQACDYLRNNYTTYTSSIRCLNGPLGAIFRDRWYRRQINKASGSKKQSLIESIRYNPLRIMNDYFLDYRGRIHELSRLLNYDISTIKRILNLFRSEEFFIPETSNPKISEMELLKLFLTKTEVSFRGFSPIVTSRHFASNITLREYFLISTIVESTRFKQTRSELLRLMTRLLSLFDWGAQYGDSLVKIILNISHLQLKDLFKASSDLNKEELLFSEPNWGASRIERDVELWSNVDWGLKKIESDLSEKK